MASTTEPPLPVARAQQQQQCGAQAGHGKPRSDLSHLIPRLPAPRRRRQQQQQQQQQPDTTNPIPIPTSPPLPSPPVLRPKQFVKPSRRILSPQDLEAFVESPTYGLVLSFVFALTDAVRDCPASKADVDERRDESARPDGQQDEGASPDGQEPRDQDALPADDKSAAANHGARTTPDDRGKTTVQKILKVLSAVEAVVRRCPPVDQGGSRFGNPGFRTFLDALQHEHRAWHRDLGVHDDDADAEADAIDEVSTYLLQSFGNRSRIDYGSGHELNFVIWLLCLYQLRLIGPQDFRTVVLKVFARYLDVMRLIQTTYYLEPAGSHGVWGLDDYQFLPFLFGASQLVQHRTIRPLSIHQPLALEEHAHDYLYLGQVAFVNDVKNVADDNGDVGAGAGAGTGTGIGLRWHSPLLDDISAAKSWAKIEAGMRRMFVAEVLRKLPVMQHFLFGSLVPAVDGVMGRETDVDADADVDVDADVPHTVLNKAPTAAPGHAPRHVHDHDSANSWGDCCGIRVPSGIGAASEEMKKKKTMNGKSNGAGVPSVLRRVPFD